MRRLAVLAIFAAASIAAIPTTAQADPIDRTVSVKNTNRSLWVACLADGTTRSVHARVFGPADKLAAAGVHRVNVLVHDFTIGGAFWDIPGSSYVRGLVQAGEVAVIIDRLGYGASPRPAGMGVCLGSQADMLHQIISKVRGGTLGPAADTVVVHGHSAGAGIAEIEAARWKDVDALVVMSWSQLGASVKAIEHSTRQHTACLLGGDTDAPKGYAWFGKTRDIWDKTNFVTASSAVRDAAAQHRSPDPCGDAMSLAQLFLSTGVFTHTINVPVLLAFGGKDTLNRPEAATLQSSAYGPDATVSLWQDANAGNFLPLEASAPQLQHRVVTWLRTLP